MWDTLQALPRLVRKKRGAGSCYAPKGPPTLRLSAQKAECCGWSITTEEDIKLLSECPDKQSLCLDGMLYEFYNKISLRAYWPTSSPTHSGKRESPNLPVGWGGCWVNIDWELLEHEWYYKELKAHNSTKYRDKDLGLSDGKRVGACRRHTCWGGENLRRSRQVNHGNLHLRYSLKRVGIIAGKGWGMLHLD